MAKMGFKNLSNDPFAYTELASGSGSAAVGMDNGTGTFNIKVNATTLASSFGGQINIDPSTNGNIAFAPNGTGGLLAPATYGYAVGATNQVMVIDSTGLIGSSASAGGGGGLIWTVITTDTTAVAGHGYICNGAGTVTVTLPATAAVGAQFGITGMNNATGWKLAEASGQTIHFGVATTTTTTGYLQSAATYNVAQLVCNVANSGFVVLSAQGNITVV